jgi:hypothetical protein
MDMAKLVIKKVDNRTIRIEDLRKDEPARIRPAIYAAGGNPVTGYVYLQNEDSGEIYSAHYSDIEVDEEGVLESAEETVRALNAFIGNFNSPVGAIVNTPDGEMTLQDALDRIGNETKQKTATLSASGWEADSGKYKYQLTDSDIESSSRVDIVPATASLDVFRTAEFEPYLVISAGLATIWAKYLPTDDISIYYEIRI